MPKEKAEKSLCMSGLRHAEYYGMQEVFDGLYAKSSKNETFTNLMNIILKRENILLAIEISLKKSLYSHSIVALGFGDIS